MGLSEDEEKRLTATLFAASSCEFLYVAEAIKYEAQSLSYQGELTTVAQKIVQASIERLHNLTFTPSWATAEIEKLEKLFERASTHNQRFPTRFPRSIAAYNLTQPQRTTPQGSQERPRRGTVQQSKIGRVPSVETLERSMPTEYYKENIRTLLIKGFNESELRSFILTEDTFKPLQPRVADRASQEEIIRLILEHAEHHQFEPLLQWARKTNPVRYNEHQPYYQITGMGLEFIKNIGEELIDMKPPQSPTRPDPVDVWDMAQIKSCLHAQAEVVAQEAVDQARSDPYDLLSGFIRFTYDLRWRRGYATTFEKLLKASDNGDTLKRLGVRV